MTMHIVYVAKSGLCSCGEVVWLCVAGLGNSVWDYVGVLMTMPQNGKCGGELGLGPPVFPRPGSVPAVAQWFTALLCPEGNSIQDLRTTSIPNTPHVATK